MRRNAKGFTLLELIVAMVASSLLLVGLASALFVTLQATQDDVGGHEDKFQSGQVLSDLAGELRCAQSFTTRTDKVVEFTVSDRTGDGNDDTIRWSWSGATGAPLTRKVNSASAITMLEDVQAFSLSYAIKSLVETTQGSGSVTTGPYMMSYFEGWTGITPSKLNYALGSTTWASQYFKVVGIPAQATSVSINSVSLRIRKKTSGNVLISIHNIKAAGNVEPATSPIAAATTYDVTPISTSYDWVPITLSGVTVAGYQDEFVILAKGSATGVADWEQYFSSSAPVDNTVNLTSSNSGTSWTPITSQRNRYDCPFRAYGSYTSPGQSNQEITRYFVVSGNLSLQAGTDASNRVETAIDIVNRPEVAQP